jgi:hypothetical protein
LSSLNLADTCRGLAVGWKPNAIHEGWFSGPNGEFEQQAPLDMSGIVALASAIKDVMRALSCDDGKHYDPKLPADWIAIKDEGRVFYYNSVSKQAKFDRPASDSSCPCTKCGKAKACHQAKGTISTVIVNTFPLPIQDIKSKAELDFSGKRLRAEDAVIIAALIPSNVS